MARRRRAGGIRERAFTTKLAGFFAPPRGRGALGIGDDAAVVVNRAAQTVVACDPVVEGVHFASGTPLRLVGRKAVNRNLADLAAMGAVFDYAVVSVLWPERFPARGLMALMRGVRDAVEGHRGRVVGGDTGSTRGPLTVTVTALGHLPGRVLRRDGARAGDFIYVSAPLGGASLGHHLRFAPPLALGLRLARSASVSAAIDVSDGLAIDLATLLRASSLAAGSPLCAVLDPERVPISAAARRLARRTGRDALAYALGDGEDHALLYTRRPPPSPARRPRRMPRDAIGVVVARPVAGDAGAVFLTDPQAGPPRRVVGGYEHLLGGRVR